MYDFTEYCINGSGLVQTVTIRINFPTIISWILFTDLQHFLLQYIPFKHKWKYNKNKCIISPTILLLARSKIYLTKNVTENKEEACYIGSV